MTCAAGEKYGAVGGTGCQPCNGFEPCSQELQGKNSSCAPGFLYDPATDTCLESKTLPSFTGVTATMTATLDSRQLQCAAGFMRGKPDAQGVVPAGADYQCLQCPDLQVCLLAGGAANRRLENNWCYLRDPATDYAALGLLGGPERLPEWQARWCIDCNAAALADSLCTFATNYFTTQPGSNITCPSTSKSLPRAALSGPATGKAVFASDTRAQRYPYCTTDTELFTGTPVRTTRAAGASGGSPCGPYEY